jgi:hypothetical protein
MLSRKERVEFFVAFAFFMFFAVSGYLVAAISPFDRRSRAPTLFLLTTAPPRSNSITVLVH